MKYVDGFVVPVPKKNLAAYKRMSQLCGKIWREHGALDYKECVADDVKPGKLTSFPQSVLLKRGEVVVFSWIGYKSRKHRDTVNKKAMADPRLAHMMDPKKMPFDGKRMFFGGFKIFIDAEVDDAPAQILLVAALALAATAAIAQQPPPGAGPPRGAPPPPPPGAPPPPRGAPPPAVVFVPVPAPVQAPQETNTAPAVLPPAPVVEAPKPQELPSAVKPFPQLEKPTTPAPLEFASERGSGSAGRVAADAAPLAAAAAAAPAPGPQPLPRWLWLLAGACALLLAGLYAALRKSRVLGDEAERLARTQRHLQSQHVQLKSQSEHLRQLATNDPLTGIFNRQAFSNELRRVIEHLARFHRPLNLLLFDMDNFKQINDGKGHLVGDQAIRMVVGVVQEHLDSDDLFGRFGGDEFMIAVADQPLEKVQVLADAIRLAVLRTAAQHEPSLAGLSLSIGIAQANEANGYAAELLFQRADTALYAAKNAGRNRVVLADEGLAPPPVEATATRHLA